VVIEGFERAVNRLGFMDSDDHPGLGSLFQATSSMFLDLLRACKGWAESFEQSGEVGNQDQRRNLSYFEEAREQRIRMNLTLEQQHLVSQQSPQEPLMNGNSHHQQQYHPSVPDQLEPQYQHQDQLQSVVPQSSPRQMPSSSDLDGIMLDDLHWWPFGAFGLGNAPV